MSRTQRDEDRLRLEIQEHLALQTSENLREGMSPSEARRQAALKFGAVEAIRESYRDQKGLPVWIDGHSEPGPKDDHSAIWDRVTAGYFEVIGNPIVKGRGITEQDTATSRAVAVINEAFARKFFKNENPIGKHFGDGIEAPRRYEIVGVARDARYLTFGLGKPIGPFYFLPEAQYFEGRPGSYFLHDIVIVTKPGASLSIAQVSHALAAVDPNLPLISVLPLRDQVAGQFNQQRLMARLTSFFGILSLVLASIGLYDVTAYNAGRRVNEIGLRKARR